MDASSQPRLQFDDVVVDRGAMLVTKSGVRVDLEPKAFDVLSYLAARPGQLVTKAELIDAIWKNVAVTDHVLTRIIGQVRRALGDDAREARYIETVPTRGYRFVARLEPAGAGLAEPLAASVPAASTPAVAALAPGRARTHRALWAAAAVLGLTLAAAGGWSLAQRREARDDWSGPPPLPRQLTFAASLDVYPDFSPDGRLLAYATSASGAFEIEVRPMARDARARQITSDGANNIQPDWSPDGEQIAYHSMRGGGIWLVPAFGGVSRRIVPIGASPAWSPDGLSIVYQSGEPATVEVGGTPPPSRLMVFDVGAGRPRPLTRAGHPIGAHTEPAWSPDGRRVAFVVRAVAQTEIWTVGVDGGEPTQLWQCYPGCSRVAYEPGGGAVIFSVRGQGYVRLAIDAASGVAAGRPAVLVSQRGDAAGHLAMSADGKSVAVTELSTRSNLYALALDARGQAAGEPVAITNGTGRTMTPVFSPDGTRVAFVARREATQVCLVAPTGGEVTPLPLPPAFMAMFRPAWVGNNQLMGIGIDDTSSSIVAIDPASRETRVVLQLSTRDVRGNATFLAPSLSADGRELFFAREDDDGVAIWALDVRSRAERRISGRGEAAVFPLPSPDGRWIAYERLDGDGMHLVVMPAGGGAARQLTTGRELTWPHTWDQDSERIFVARRLGSFWSIGYLVRATGRETTLTTLRLPQGYLRYPAVSPRRDRVVYERTETTGNIWQVPLWRESGATP